jgi:hypothetical protein
MLPKKYNNDIQRSFEYRAFITLLFYIVLFVQEDTAVLNCTPGYVLYISHAKEKNENLSE